jgi:hypothetical protein
MSTKCVKIYYQLYARLVFYQLLQNCRIIFGTPIPAIHVEFIAM